MDLHENVISKLIYILYVACDTAGIFIYTFFTSKTIDYKM